jgi:hypothetical protein
MSNDNSIALMQSKDKEIERLNKLLEVAKSERQDLAVLGENEVWLRKTASGGVKAVVGCVTLSEELGEIYEIAGYGDIPSKFPITAIGYSKLNQVAGISIVTPKSLRLEDGTVVVNPYVMRDRNNVIAGVWVRKVSIGRSPTGNISMISSTLQYNVGQYLVADLIKKVKNDVKAGKLCTFKSLTDAELQKGQFFSLYGDTGLWVNFESKDIFKVFETYTQNCLFAERKAQTICERNVLKKHPAFGQMYVKPQGPAGKRIAKVRIVGWTCDLSEDELQRLADQVDKGDDVTIEGQKVQFSDAIDIVEDEDIIVSADEEDVAADKDKDEEDKETVGNEQGIKNEPELDNTENNNELLKNIQQACSVLGDDKAAEVIKKNMRTSMDKLKPDQYKMALKLLKEEIDKTAN